MSMGNTSLVPRTPPPHQKKKRESRKAEMKVSSGHLFFYTSLIPFPLDPTLSTVFPKRPCDVPPTSTQCPTRSRPAPQNQPC